MIKDCHTDGGSAAWHAGPRRRTSATSAISAAK